MERNTTMVCMNIKHMSFGDDILKTDKNIFQITILWKTYWSIPEKNYHKDFPLFINHLKTFLGGKKLMRKQVNWTYFWGDQVLYVVVCCSIFVCVICLVFLVILTVTDSSNVYIIYVFLSGYVWLMRSLLTYALLLVNAHHKTRIFCVILCCQPGYDCINF